MPPYLIPYHTISCHTIPYHTIPYHTIPYHTIPYHTIPYHTIPYHTITYHTIPYHIIPYHTSPNSCLLLATLGYSCHLYFFLSLSDPVFSLARYSCQLQSFLGLCLSADPRLRPTASALLQHPFIKQAISDGVICPPIQPQLQGILRPTASAVKIEGVIRCVLDW